MNLWERKNQGLWISRGGFFPGKAEISYLSFISITCAMFKKCIMSLYPIVVRNSSPPARLWVKSLAVRKTGLWDENKAQESARFAACVTAHGPAR
ncbi:hypothetical protein Q4485_09405 [Granulosicoccaceae sp. 1_MG-2023]|nr:hypothetical protein [Granulosicoccaceae sp. 1_MG-2023]